MWYLVQAYRKTNTIRYLIHTGINIVQSTLTIGRGRLKSWNQSFSKILSFGKLEGVNVYIFWKVSLRPIRKLMFGEWFCQGHRNTDLHRIWRNRVLVKMIAVFHLKVDCSEILWAGFWNSKNSILLPNHRFLVWIKSYIFTLKQMLKLGAETEITWGLLSVSTFWRQNRILGVWDVCVLQR